MTKISEKEFARICNGIDQDRKSIIEHNPIGAEEEILFWMLMSILISYLSLAEKEIPCFPGSVSAETYRDAIKFVLRKRKADKFDEEVYLEKLANGDTIQLATEV